MNQSLLQALYGCTTAGKMQSPSAALMTGNRITRAAVNALTEIRTGDAYRLAAALNPAAGAMAAFREMSFCRGLDLRSPAEKE